MTQSISQVWIKENYNNLKKVAKKLSGENYEDALHYALLSFLEKKNLDEIISSGGGTFYIISILLRALRSKNNDFYKKTHQNHLELVEAIYVPENEEEHSFYGFTDDIVMKYLNELYWYEREVFLIYNLNDYTYKRLSAETGISRTSLNATVNRVKDYLKIKIKNEINKRH
jgi:RNA polymerase sigma factor (sigma-70 family)